MSDYNLAHLRAEYHSSAPIYRIYNGLDLDQFPYQIPRDRPPHILAVGRLVEKKGFNHLINAIARLRRDGIACECTIIGEGGKRSELAAQITALGLDDQVHLIGNRTQAEVKAYLHHAAMLVAPCIISADGDRDGLPTILVEAMALGTPCISTDIVGIPELIHDGETGLLVPPHDPDALAAAITRLLEKPAYGEHLAANARAHIEQHYDIHQNTAELREHITRGG